MAGAEGERRLDLDTNPVDRNTRAVVGAVNDETAGRDRIEAGEALADPVRRLDARELQRRSSSGPGGRCDHRAHRFLIGRGAEMNRDLPAPAAARIGQADGDIFSGEAFGNDIGQSARSLFIRFQTRNPARERAKSLAGSH